MEHDFDANNNRYLFHRESYEDFLVNKKYLFLPVIFTLSYFPYCNYIIGKSRAGNYPANPIRVLGRPKSQHPNVQVRLI